MKTIAITGASGFVGTSLTKFFSNLGAYLCEIDGRMTCRMDCIFFLSPKLKVP